MHDLLLKRARSRCAMTTSKQAQKIAQPHREARPMPPLADNTLTTTKQVQQKAQPRRQACPILLRGDNNQA